MEAALAAAARSASSQMIIGSDPPSSSVTRFVPRAASAMIRSPTGVEPVKAIFRPPGCRTSAAPVAEPPPVTTLNTPVGQTALGQQLGEAQRRQRRRPGRLGDDGVAGHQRRRQLVAQQRRGEVPRHDRADHAERPAQHDPVDARIEVGRVRAAQGLRQPHVVHQRVDRLGYLDPRVAQRLALLARQQRDQLVEVLLDVMRRPAEELAALAHRQRRPLAERLGRGRDGGIDIGLAASGHLGEHRPRPPGW